MHVEVSEGFRKTIADIVDCCVEGNTNSCTLEVRCCAENGISFDCT